MESESALPRDGDSVESPLTGLLEELREASQERSEGHFSIDRERSKQLLSRYRLEHPEAYGLNLVAAAVASGASSIEIHSTTEEFRMGFDGRPFSAEELENCTSSFILSDRSPQIVRMQELAIALQAAGTAGSESLEVTSLTPVGEVILRSKGANQSLERRPVSQAAGGHSTVIRVTKRNPLSWLKSLFVGPAEGPEAIFIRSLCGWAPARISINGQFLPRPELPRGAKLVTVLGPPSLGEVSEAVNGALQVLHVESGLNTSGVILFHPASGASHGLHLVVHGVCYNWPWDFDGWGVLHCGHLRKDLSQSALLQADVDELLAGLQDYYLEHLVALCRNYSSLASSRQPPARHHLFECRRIRMKNAQEAERFAAAYREAPLFPLVGGGSISLKQLRERDPRVRERLLFTTESWLRGCLDGTPVVDASDPSVMLALREEDKRPDGLLGIVLENGFRLLREAAEADRRQAAWKAKPLSGPSLSGEFWVLRDVAAKWQEAGWSGQVGLAKVVREFGQLSYFLQGRHFIDKPLVPAEGWPSCLSAALQHPDLEADLHWLALRDNPTLDSCWILMYSVTLGLLEEAADLWQGGSIGHPEDLQRSFALALCAPQDIYVNSRKLRELPVFRLAVPRSGYGGRRAEGPPSPREGDRLWAERHASWDELASQYERMGELPYATRSFDCGPSTGALVVLELPWLSQRVWRGRFPKLRNYENELRQAEKHAQTRRNWLERPPEPHVRLGSVPALLAKVPLCSRPEHGVTIAGELGAKQVSVPFSSVDYYVGGRPLSNSGRINDVPGLAVALDCPELEPDETCTEVSDTPALKLALDAVLGHLPELLDALAQQFPCEGVRRRQLQHQFFNCLAILGTGPEEARWAEVLCLDMVEGGYGLFCQLDEMLRAHGKVRVMKEESRPQALDGLPSICWLCREAAPPFLRWLGPERIEDYEEQYITQLVHQSQQARPTEEAKLNTDLAESVECDLGRGEIGLVHDPNIPAFAVRVRILSHGKLIDNNFVVEEREAGSQPQWAAGPLRVAAVLDCPRVWVQVQPGQLEELRCFFRERVRLLGFPWASELPHMPSEQRAWLQDYLWSRLAWEATLGGRSGDGEPLGFCMVDQDEMRAQLRRYSVFPTLRGDWVDLDHLLAEVEERERVFYFLGQAPRTSPQELVVLVRRNQLNTFKAILGARHVADASSHIAAWTSQADYQARPPVEKLELPAGDYLLRWSIEHETFRGAVGLLVNPNLPSQIAIHWRQRRLETVKIHLDFAVEACLECDQVQPNRQWTGAARDGHYEALLDEFSASIWRTILQEAPKHYLLALAVHLKAPRRQEAETLWSRPLFEDPWGEEISLSQLQAAYPRLRLLYWPQDAPIPPSRDMMPTGFPVPRLTPRLRDLLQPLFFSGIENFQPRALAAGRLLQYLPQSEPLPQTAPSELRIELAEGWLVSRLDSTDRIYQFSWRGRPLPQLARVGWPGYRGFLRTEAYPLGADGGADRVYMGVLEEAEGRLEALWLERIQQEPLSPEELQAAAPFLPSYGALADALRAALPKHAPPARIEPAATPRVPDAWQILVERVSASLRELHQDGHFKLERASMPVGWEVQRRGKQTIYQINFYDSFWRGKLEKMSSSWLASALWLASPPTAPDRTELATGRSRHQRLLEWLKQAP